MAQGAPFQTLRWAQITFRLLQNTFQYDLYDISVRHFSTHSKQSAQLSGQRLALGNQRFPVPHRLLPMCRGEFSAVTAKTLIEKKSLFQVTLRCPVRTTVRQKGEERERKFSILARHHFKLNLIISVDGICLKHTSELHLLY